MKRYHIEHGEGWGKEDTSPAAGANYGPTRKAGVEGE